MNIKLDTIFRQELEALIGKHEIDKLFDIPDYVLARYVVDMLMVHGSANERAKSWKKMKEMAE